MALLFVHGSWGRSLPDELDFNRYPVYGINTPAIHNHQEALSWIEGNQHPSGSLSEIGAQELQRYLNYNLLSHYIGFLLNLVERPGGDYLRQLTPLQRAVGKGFEGMLVEADRVAGRLAKEIRFSLTLVRLSTKHIQNGSQQSGELAVLHQRLQSISQQLQEFYPESRGELPPVLIAFVISFFGPDGGKVPVSCKNPLPTQLKSQVLQTLNGGPSSAPQSPLPSAQASPTQLLDLE